MRYAANDRRSLPLARMIHPPTCGPVLGITAPLSFASHLRWACCGINTAYLKESGNRHRLCGRKRSDAHAADAIGQVLHGAGLAEATLDRVVERGTHYVLRGRSCNDKEELTPDSHARRSVAPPGAQSLERHRDRFQRTHNSQPAEFLTL